MLRMTRKLMTGFRKLITGFRKLMIGFRKLMRGIQKLDFSEKILVFYIRHIM